MSVVVSVKVPRKVKEAMDRMKASVNWSEEIRNYILDKLAREKRIENTAKVEEILQGIRRLPKGSTSGLIREDRDRHH